jgi:hypothetical protein
MLDQPQLQARQRSRQETIITGKLLASGVARLLTYVDRDALPRPPMPFCAHARSFSGALANAGWSYQSQLRPMGQARGCERFEWGVGSGGYSGMQITPLLNSTIVLLLNYPAHAHRSTVHAARESSPWAAAVDICLYNGAHIAPQRPLPPRTAHAD